MTDSGLATLPRPIGDMMQVALLAVIVLLDAVVPQLLQDVVDVHILVSAIETDMTIVGAIAEKESVHDRQGTGI